MKTSGKIAMTFGIVLSVLGCAPGLHAQAFLVDIRAEHDPVKRSEKALTFANTAFDDARSEYTKGNISGGDADLENMTNALKECVGSLETAHKAKFFKRAEMNVAALQRRLQGVVEDLGAQERGWAEYTQRKVEEIHDALLTGVMGK